MGQRLSADKMELYRRVDEVLFYVWDPIGISNSPDARDEYQGYLPGVFELLLSESNIEEKILEYLLKIEVKRMGLQNTDSSRFKAGKAAKNLIAYKKLILEKSPETLNV